MLPRAPIEPEGMFAGLSGSAILLGAFVDVAATDIVSGLLRLWLAPEVMSHDQEVARKAIASLAASNAYLMGSVVIGALCTVIGAFVGARRAGKLQVRHGGWIAVTSTAVGVLLTAILHTPTNDGVEYPLWAQAFAWLLILPAGMSGGAIAAALPAHPRKER